MSQNQQFTIALIAAFCAGLPAVANFIILLRTNRRTQEIKENLQDVHTAVNGRMDNLLAATATTAKAEGVAEEKARQEVTP